MFTDYVKGRVLRPEEVESDLLGDGELDAQEQFLAELAESEVLRIEVNQEEAKQAVEAWNREAEEKRKKRMAQRKNQD